MITVPFTDRFIPAPVVAGLAVAIAGLLIAALVSLARRRRRPAAAAPETSAAVSRPASAPVAAIRSASAVALVAGFVVAGIGAWFSFHGLRDAARPAWGVNAWAFPICVDGVILVGTLGYVVTVLRGHPLAMLQRLAYAGIGLTVFFNALASQRPGLVWWHVVPPLLWGVLAHIAAKLAMMRLAVEAEDDEVDPAEIRARLARISLPMWLTPVRTGQLWTYLARHPRVGLEEGQQHIELLRGARKALSMRLPGVSAWPTRRAIMGPVRAGVVPPVIVIEATRPDDQGVVPDAAAVHYRVLSTMLTDRPLRGDSSRPPASVTDAPEPTEAGRGLETAGSPGDPGDPPGREAHHEAVTPYAGTPARGLPLTPARPAPLPLDLPQNGTPPVPEAEWDPQVMFPSALRPGGGDPVHVVGVHVAPAGSPPPGDGYQTERKAWARDAADEDLVAWLRYHELPGTATTIRKVFGFGGSSTRPKAIADLINRPQLNIIQLPRNDT